MNKHDRIMWLLILLCLIAIAVMFLPRKAGASDGLPEGVIKTWLRSDGSICSAVITDNGVALDCDCLCAELRTISPNGEKPVPSETPKDKPGDGFTDMHNPATRFCIDAGYIYETITELDGGQHGVCKHGNKVCDAWAFYNGTCSLK
ncbi:DUF333 domain-containing protein, partial [Candidatus Pacearchaeota archaeon]|nr:DUF333 domain-containing protein [Candidatus Pacearchaeota archaeon]